MKTTKDPNRLITLIEQKEGLLGVESEAKGLYYFVDKKGKDVQCQKLRITVSRNSEFKSIELSLTQAKALLKELQDVCEMQWNNYIRG